MTEKIDEVLHAAVARGDVPGVVALAAGDDGVLYEGAAGRRAADPITADTMLRIASMTTTATLQLAERGALELDAPGGDLPAGIREPAGACRSRRRFHRADEVRPEELHHPPGTPARRGRARGSRSTTIT